MGRQSSRIYFNGQDHKEMVTWDGSKYQYHDAAYIWNDQTESFELVWEKLKDEFDLWVEWIDGIDFYNLPAIIKSRTGDVNYYIDYNPNAKEFRKVYTNGEEDDLRSSSTTAGGIDFGTYFRYTKAGLVPVPFYSYRATQNSQTSVPFSLYDMEDLTTTVGRLSITHGNFRTAGGAFYLFNEFVTPDQWIDGNDDDNCLSIGTYRNTYTNEEYILICNLNTRTHEYNDYVQYLPIRFSLNATYPYRSYYDLVNFVIRVIENRTDKLVIFEWNMDESTPDIKTVGVNYEYELPLQNRSVIQVDDNHILNYTLTKNGRDIDVEYYLISLDATGYFQNIKGDFKILAHDTVKFTIKHDPKPNNYNITLSVDTTHTYLYLYATYIKADSPSGENFYGYGFFRQNIKTKKIQKIGIKENESNLLSTDVLLQFRNSCIDDGQYFLGLNSGLRHLFRLTTEKPSE